MIHRCLPGSLCGVDIDDLFPFATTKTVHIRDARLGILRIALMVLIVIYIGVWQLFAQRKYLLNLPASGTARLSLEEPHTRGHK